MICLKFQQNIISLCVVLMMGLFFVISCTNADVKTFRKAAERGDAEAQYSLGHCYYHSLGVIQDKKEAVRWYRKAAEQGHAQAQYILGLCYDVGDGRSKDTEKAIAWYRKAAAQGNDEAIKELSEQGIY
jgi:TPR repeat protein